MAKVNKEQWIEDRAQEYMDKNPGKYKAPEALELAEYDWETDHMTDKEIRDELTPEEKAARKAATKVSRAPAAPGEKKARKPRKEDPIKRQLMALAAQMLQEAGYADVNVSNPEKMVDFVIDGVEYSFSLIKHRAKKED